MLNINESGKYEFNGVSEEIKKYCSSSNKLEVGFDSLLQSYENLSTALEIFSNIDTSNADKIGYEFCKLIITNRLVELYQVVKQDYSKKGEDSQLNLSPLYIVLFARIKYLCDECEIKSPIIDTVIGDLKTTFNYDDCVKYLQLLTTQLPTPLDSTGNKENVEVVNTVEKSETVKLNKLQKAQKVKVETSGKEKKPKYKEKYNKRNPYFVGDGGGLFSEFIREAMTGLGYNRYQLITALGIPTVTLVHMMDYPFKWYHASKHRIVFIYLHLGERMTVRSFVNDIIRIMRDDPQYEIAQKRYHKDLIQEFLKEYPTEKIRDIMDETHKIVQEAYRKADKEKLTDKQKEFFKKFSVTLKDLTKEEEAVPYQKPKILEVRKSYIGNCVSTATPVSTPVH